MASSSSKLAENRRAFTCNYKECENQIVSASPKTKFCKKHRQNIYKHNYIERGHRLRIKYQESRACFHGSPDPFDGQDLDDMLQQILMQKRLELMNSPQIVEFFKGYQNGVRDETKRKATQTTQKSFGPEKGNNSDHFLSYHSRCHAGQDETKIFQSIDQPLPLVVDKQETINTVTDLQLKKKKSCDDEKDKILQTNFKDTESENERSVFVLNFDGESNKLDTTSTNIGCHLHASSSNFSLPMHLSNQSRRSAFQETGAGDAQSLFAIRAIMPTD